MTTAKYIISDEFLTFYYQDEVRSINSKSVLYHAVREQLLNGEELDIHLSTSVNDFIVKALQTGSFYQPAVDRVKSLEKQNLPTEPLIQFIKNVPEAVLESHPEIVNIVGTTEFPLTWDGNLVAYQRSSWVAQDNTSSLLSIQDSDTTSWVEDFSPFGTVDKTSTVGGFTWCQSRCPDAGCMYEVMVNASQIADVRTSMFEVKSLTYLVDLGRFVKESAKAESAIVDYTHKVEDDKRFILRLPYNAATASKLVSSLFSGVPASSLSKITNSPVTTRVPVLA